jgi:predicted AAA+ superfamily ATPase
LKWKKVLEYNSKYYWTDVWLRNIFGYDYSKDIANILENIVYNKLRQDAYQVYVWANRWLEIDFVAEKNWERIYIQVCYLLATPEVVDREFWNLEKIKDNYRKIVLSLDNVFWNTHNWIEHLNIIDWLL